MASTAVEHRKYYSDNKEIPSCTTIVGLLGKPELVSWANYMGFKKINTKEFTEEKAAYGTHCHELFERYFMGITMSANGSTDFLSKEEYRLIIYKFRMIELFFEKLGIKVLNMEFPMEGRTYGGTLDMICYNSVKDCLMIFDLKTSKEVRQSHWIQIMGYVQLIEEIYHLPVEEIGVILLSKDLHSPELVNIRTTKDCWRELAIFNKLRDIYYFLNGTDETVQKLFKGGDLRET
jgi:CRISPR/Cas system-associated exonuclease Cas4 (RecB family)